MSESFPARKWLIVTQYYPPEVGAPQIRLEAMARELVRQGQQVEVLTCLPNYPAGKVFPEYAGKEGKGRRREVLDGITIRRTPVYAATGKSKIKRLANYFSFTFFAFFAALFGPRPDVIFLESQPLSLGIVGVAMKWFRRVPYVYNVPDLQVEVARQMGFIRNERFLRLAQWVENFFCRRSWKISTVTDKFIEHFVERGLPRSQVTFLPNGADAEFLRPMEPDAELTAKWNLAGKRAIVYVGTQAYYHGLDTLIDAATILRDRSDIVFVILGDGPEHPRLVQTAEQRHLPNVVFDLAPYRILPRIYSIAYASVATLRNIDVAKQMRLAKIFPSFSCGVPVVFSGLGESAELIQNNQVGVTVEPERPECLANAIRELVDDPARRQALSAAGRDFILRDYSWSSIVERWLNELDHPVNG